MKHYVIIVIAALLLVSSIAPAYANSRQENNQNIADFVADTVKLPLILLGYFVTQGDHDQVVQDTNYQEHKGLDKALSGDTQYIGAK